MIFKGSNILPYLYSSGKKIRAIYKTDEDYDGTDSSKKHLVWLTTFIERIKSCYGSGRWLNNKNWVSDKWKN